MDPNKENLDNEYLYEENYNDEDYINEGFPDNEESQYNSNNIQPQEFSSIGEQDPYNHEEKDTEPIYEMTLEIEGQSKVIKVYSDSNAEELAYDFCRQHNLDISALKYLEAELANLILQYKSKNEDNSHTH